MRVCVCVHVTRLCRVGMVSLSVCVCVCVSLYCVCERGRILIYIMNEVTGLQHGRVLCNGLNEWMTVL